MTAGDRLTDTEHRELLTAAATWANTEPGIRALDEWPNVTAVVEAILTARASTAQDEAGEVARLRAQVAAVEALADEWERDYIAYTPRGTAAALRAALDQATGSES